MQSFELPHFHDEDDSIEKLHRHIVKNEQFMAVSELFLQLSDVTRVRIFWLLCHCEECVMNISALVGVPATEVMYHLGSLRASGLLLSRRSKEEVYFKAADTEESQLLHLMIEKMLEIKCPDSPLEDICAHGECEGFTAEQIETAHKVHEYLTYHLDSRHTIESLSRRFLINQTTLKSVFRAVYGNSIAAHIKEHRMEAAAKLLSEEKLSVAETAERVGYASQSKFTEAFKSAYGVLPIEYKNKNPDDR